MGNDNKQWCVVAFCDQRENTLRASPTLPERNVVIRALLVILKSSVRLVPSFVELHCGTVFGCDRLFLLAITRSWIQIRPQIASNGKLQLSRGNREVNGNCNWWHAWFDCCCIAKSNRGTVYAPKDIPNRNHPPPPPPKKCKKCIIYDVFAN